MVCWGWVADFMILVSRLDTRIRVTTAKKSLEKNDQTCR